jgi:hypothetical protein
MGFSPFPVPRGCLEWARRGLRPAWTFCRWANASEQTPVDTCNGDRFFAAQRDHNQEQPLRSIFIRIFEILQQMNLSILQVIPNVLAQSFFGIIVANIIDQFCEKHQYLLKFLKLQELYIFHTWFASPCKGPARPAREAENERYGSESAEPTKWQVWAETFPPSWSLWIVR